MNIDIKDENLTDWQKESLVAWATETLKGLVDAIPEDVWNDAQKQAGFQLRELLIKHGADIRWSIEEKKKKKG